MSNCILNLVPMKQNWLNPPVIRRSVHRTYFLRPQH